MKPTLLAKSVVCLGFLGFSVCSYLSKHNTCMALKMQIPKVMEEIKIIQEENEALSYQIECFENPQNLLNIAKSCQFSHLQFPPLENILAIKKDGILPKTPNTLAEKINQPTPPVVIGSRS
jgi:cell division protein FtsL